MGWNIVRKQNIWKGCFVRYGSIDLYGVNTHFINLNERTGCPVSMDTFINIKFTNMKYLPGLQTGPSACGCPWPSSVVPGHRWCSHSQQPSSPINTPRQWASPWTDIQKTVKYTGYVNKFLPLLLHDSMFDYLHVIWTPPNLVFSIVHALIYK